MILFSRDKIKSSFTKICSIAVAFMIGYWVYKYKVEDRDIGIVDYLALKTANHIGSYLIYYLLGSRYRNY